MMRYSTDPVCRVWQVHTSLFKKKSIAHTKIVALRAAALYLRDLHLTQYRGVLTSQFSHPCLNSCFLISMVHEVIYESMDWQLSVILFVALLLGELNGKTLTY